ncbi:fimbrial biogenesis outer membrane usher protein [Salmonella enterica]|nr:fimbrial biogenesis outer membrane usher protein [Salmonella enterica]EKC2694340.1 fimbrial biogenesis outer membrane usher protein [Salmonella enterica]
MMTRYILSRHLTMGCMSLLALSISQAVSAGQLVTPQSSLPLSTEEDSSALTFNPDFLKFSDGDAAKNVNLSYFSYKGGQEPGTYRVDIIVNGKYTDTQTLQFQSLKDKPGQLYACVTPDVYGQWGITLPDSQAATAQHNINNATCPEGLAQRLPGATEHLDLNQRTLQITVPQSYLAPPGWFETPPHQWDEGMPAVMVNYNFSGNEQTNAGQHYHSQFLSLNSVLNFGGWRLHYDGNWTSGTSSASKWQSLNTWLQHDYARGQGGQLTIGQTTTDSAIFDGFPFEGIQVASDDGMLQSMLTSYAPVIRGIAYSQAQVSVRQNGTIIYQKNVPAGAFAFRDVPQVYSGDVTVEVREADGSVHRTIQTAATVPVLQREGRLRYNVAAGRYRQPGNQNTGRDNPEFVQATAAWGLPYSFTLYGGAMLARNYQAGILGTGRYFETLGALSLDVTQARSRFTSRYRDGEAQQGQSWRFDYARSFNTTNTTFNLTGYRYATEGFYTFNELQQLQGTGEDHRTDYHQRSRLMTMLTQDLGDSGQLSLSGSQDSYWNYNGHGYNWIATYSVGLGPVSSSLSLGYNRTPQYQQADKSVLLNFSIPLGTWLGGNVSANTSTTLRNGTARQQAGVSGSLDNSKLTYSIMQGRENHGQGAGGNANLAYQGSYGQLSGGYSYQHNSQQWLYGVTGGITLHPHGVTFSQPVSLSGGNALVEAPGASNVPLLSGTGLATDWRGYTVVPNLVPYQRNTVALDMGHLSENMDIQASDNVVIPTRGSLVSAPFRVSVGGRALVTLTYHGLPVPFGSIVTLKSEASSLSSMVADEGQVYFSGLPDKGRLMVNWGQGAGNQCIASYTLDSAQSVLNNIHAECR